MGTPKKDGLDRALEMMSQDDFFNEANAVSKISHPYFNLKNIGDHCRGFLVQVSDAPDLNKEGCYQRVYTCVVPDGEEYEMTVSAKNNEYTKVKGGELFNVYGRMPITDSKTGRSVKIVKHEERMSLGQMVGFKYTGDEKKSNSFYPAKILKLFLGEEFRPDLVEKFGSKMSSSDNSGLPF